MKRFSLALAFVIATLFPAQAQGVEKGSKGVFYAADSQGWNIVVANDSIKNTLGYVLRHGGSCVAWTAEFEVHAVNDELNAVLLRLTNVDAPNFRNQCIANVTTVVTKEKAVERMRAYKIRDWIKEVMRPSGS